MKKTLVTLAKYAISFGIVYWLITDVKQDDPNTFLRLRDEPKDWSLLLAATTVCFTAVVLTIYRWYLLVRALDLPFRRKDAFRLGFLGYFLNFASVGAVGGDLFKAVFLAREQPGRRAQAVATVVVDRLIGLYALCVVTTAGILISGLVFRASVDSRIVVVSWIAIGATVGGALALAVMMRPGFSRGRLAQRMETLPKVGPTLESLIEALRIYRSRQGVLATTLLMSIGVHCLFTLGVYLIACGLPGAHPTLGQHFIVVPMSMTTGVLPLPMAGLGAFEGVMKFYYQNVSATRIPGGQGLLVALAYRAATLAIAVVGLVFWLLSRKDVAEVMHEAEGEHEVLEPAIL